MSSAMLSSDTRDGIAHALSHEQQGFRVICDAMNEDGIEAQAIADLLAYDPCAFGLRMRSMMCRYLSDQ